MKQPQVADRIKLDRARCIAQALRFGAKQQGSPEEADLVGPVEEPASDKLRVSFVWKMDSGNRYRIVVIPERVVN